MVQVAVREPAEFDSDGTMIKPPLCTQESRRCVLSAHHDDDHQFETATGMQIQVPRGFFDAE